MNPMTEAEKILKELTANRIRVVKMENERTDLYAKQTALYIKGDAAGLKATEMARAMQSDGDITHLAESVRQKIRPAKKARAKKS